MTWRYKLMNIMLGIKSRKWAMPDDSDVYQRKITGTAKINRMFWLKCDVTRYHYLLQNDVTNTICQF